MPRTLLVADVRPAEVAKLVDRELEERGALLDEKTHARTVFEGLDEGGSFRRGGYVGFYQPLGEKDVEILVQAWATGPRKAFWGTVVVQLLAVVALVAASPPSVVWFAAAVVLWPWFLLVGLVYLLTFRASRAAEVALVDAFEAACRRTGWTVLDQEAQLERTIRLRLEGEVKERELAARAEAAGEAAGGKRGRGGLVRAKPAPKAKPARARKPGKAGAGASSGAGAKKLRFGRKPREPAEPEAGSEQDEAGSQG